MAGGHVERSLKETPTWSVALVNALFVVISVLIEHGIHSLGKWFQERHQRAMIEALEKIKAEMMLLGFISLLIAAGTQPISKICIPARAGDIMLPCKAEQYKDRRRLLWYPEQTLAHRILAAGGDSDYCFSRGKVPLISKLGVHQLHIFIFVLAVFHVLYSMITMFLAQAKMKKWKAWELETTSFEYQFYSDPSRFRFTHQTTFVREHSGFSRKPGIRWIVAFFRQFFSSVTKVDYLIMRHGFINAHFAPNSRFDFHKYIKRSMEDDFKVVVGISIPLWTFAILFQLVNVYSWYTLLALSFVPAAILLVIGAKLQIVIMDMAQQIQDRNTVVKGVPLVEPNNEHFWFNRPDLILFLIHFTLFQNAFQMAYFIWSWYEFGLKSCFHENLLAIVAKVLLGVAFQVFCSYITFPLYALVTQMGSHMKRGIFNEQVAKALKKWHKTAKERRKKAGADCHRTTFSTEKSPQDAPKELNHVSSPPQILNQIYKTSNCTETVSTLRISPIHFQSEISETECHDCQVMINQQHPTL
ncbi:hypothetical protein LIER_33229 [Lithospermum erythrorhizon]|uniref:MLO-like protein n=1 Tax=Lithospermum erythrorhizon TaxID=34254 RepID=A0AAV3S1D2_LITER